MTIEKSEIAFGQLVNAARVRENLEEMLQSLKDDLKDKLGLMNSLLDKIALVNSLISGIREETGEIAGVGILYLKSLHQNIQNQGLLEQNILEDILLGIPTSSSGNINIGLTMASTDSDKNVTMLACFKFPPYVRIADIESFLELEGI